MLLLHLCINELILPCLGCHRRHCSELWGTVPLAFWFQYGAGTCKNSWTYSEYFRVESKVIGWSISRFMFWGMPFSIIFVLNCILIPTNPVHRAPPSILGLCQEEDCRAWHVYKRNGSVVNWWCLQTIWSRAQQVLYLWPSMALTDLQNGRPECWFVQVS